MENFKTGGRDAEASVVWKGKNMITIDREKCIGCGLCADDCPAGRIRIEEQKAVWQEGCIQCGHCVAVCPRNAVKIPEYDMDNVEEYEEGNSKISSDVILRMVKFRRSIRNYTSRIPEREKLELMLEAGRYTPTAKNSQGCRFIVLVDELEAFKKEVWKEMPAIAERLKETAPHYSMAFRFMYRRKRKDSADDALFFNAPVCILIISENVLDAGLAAANMENMAVSEGMGVLYDGYLQRIIDGCPELKEWLGISGSRVACCMLAGYSAVTYKRTAPRKKADAVWR